MSSVLLAVLSFVGFIAAYRLYGRFLGQKIFGIRDTTDVPACQFEDGVDHVPTRTSILFGHHFTTISGAGPIVGPAIAVIWGWLPALLWVVIGSVFIGGLHDFGSLVISCRMKGKSIGEVSKDILGPNVRLLFLFIIFFLLIIVIAVFAYIIAILFKMYPQSVIPIWVEIPIAIWLGYMIYSRKGSHRLYSVIALVLMYATIYLGTLQPVSLADISFIGKSGEIYAWMIILLVYVYIASTLPVHRLLQPRDYINAHELYVGLGAIVLGLLVLRPEIVAPAWNVGSVKDAPAIIPFLFVIVACGAVSGFHSLAASGTTVKQLSNEKDALPIAYGSMLLEGALAIIVIIACCAGFEKLSGWQEHYASWAGAKGLGAKLKAFIDGSGRFVSALCIPLGLAKAIIAVVVVSFAATTLDSATRIQRYVVNELAADLKIKPLTKRHPATIVAVAIPALLVFWPLIRPTGGNLGMALWPIFGAANQMLAGLVLLVITVYLLKRGKGAIYALVPMVFLIVITTWAMIMNIWSYTHPAPNADGSPGQINYVLTVVGLAILVLEVWMIIEAVRAFLASRKQKLEPDVQS
jgi:carbon starvation protein